MRPKKTYEMQKKVYKMQTNIRVAIKYMRCKTNI